MSPVREHLAQLVADEVDDRLEVELLGHALLDAVDHRELGVALLGLLQQPLRLVEQARVLERDAHAGDDRCSSRTSASPNAYSRSKFSTTTTPSTRSPPTIGTATLDSEHSVPGHGDARGRASAARVARRSAAASATSRAPARLGRGVSGGSVQAHAALDTRTGSAAVRVAWSYQRMPMVVDAQHLAQLVADQLDDRLEVELAGHALLDAVDDRELGVALLGLLQQPLRLVEQARVLERDAHARGDRGEQPHSASPKACSRSWFSSTMTPSTRSPPRIGTPAIECAQVGAGAGRSPALRLLGARVRHHAAAASRSSGDGPAGVERPRRRQRQRPVVLVR